MVRARRHAGHSLLLLTLAIAALLALVPHASAAAAPPAESVTLLPRSGDLVPSGAAGAASAWTEHGLVLAGGRSATTATADALVIDGGGAVRTLPSALPSPRAGVAAASGGRLVYLFGGEDASGNPLDDVLVLDPESGEARTLDARLPTPRSSASAVWDGSGVLVMGGRDGEGPLRDVLRFDPRTERVMRLDVDLPHARSDAKAVWDGERALLFGGEPCGSDTGCGLVLRVDPEKRSADVTDPGELGDSRGAVLGAAWDGREALVVVSPRLGRAEAQLVAYDPEADRSRIVPAPLPAYAGPVAAAWDGDGLLVVGSDRAGERAYAARVDADLRTTTFRGPVLPAGAVASDGERAWFFGEQVAWYDPSSGNSTVLPLSVPQAAAADAHAVWAGDVAVVATRAGFFLVDPDAREVRPWPKEAPVHPGPLAWNGEHVFVLGRGDCRPAERELQCGAILRLDPASGDVRVMEARAPAGGNRGGFWHEGRAFLVRPGEPIGVYDPERDVMGSVAAAPRAGLGVAWSGERAVLFGAPRADGLGVEGVVSLYEPRNGSVDESVVRLPWREGVSGATWAGGAAVVAYRNSDELRLALLAEYRPGASVDAVRFQLSARGLTAQGDASGTLDHDGSAPSSFEWHWGDGTVSTGERSRHEYDARGDYTVHLVVRYESGAVATASRGLFVDGPSTPRPLNAPPDAAFDVSVEGATVRADGSASRDPDGEPLTFEWSWGDGGSSSGITATHEYMDAGAYVVTLTVRDSAGEASETSTLVRVEEGARRDAPSGAHAWAAVAAAVVAALARRRR